MKDLPKQSGFAAGINNKAPWRQMPDNTLRDAVNVDALESGVLAMRSGFEQMYAGTAVRGALAVGEHILVADGTNLVDVDTRTNSWVILATIAGSGIFAGDVLNEELFFCTANANYRYKAGSLRSWGVPTVTSQPVPTVVAGNLDAGGYQLAMTWVDASGQEGATTTPINITVATGQGLQVILPAMSGFTPRLYVGAVNGETLYLQKQGSGTYLVANVATETERLGTFGLREPQPAKHIVAHNSVIAMADGSVVWVTAAMRPHLVDRARRFFSFASEVGMVLSTRAGLVVSADKTYMLTDIEGDSPSQVELFPFPAVPGTGVKMPLGEAAWMTPYGLAVTNGQSAQLLNDTHFVPQLASDGSSGIVQNNGNQMVVTTMRSKGQNPLLASDYYEGEIITP